MWGLIPVPSDQPPPVQGVKQAPSVLSESIQVLRGQECRQLDELIGKYQRCCTRGVESVSTW